MNTGSKFFVRRARPINEQPFNEALSADEAAFAFLNSNRVTTRRRGDIPGCVPAVDVFIERSPEETRLWTLASADRYIHQMRTMDFKEFINAPLERAPPNFRSYQKGNKHVA